MSKPVNTSPRGCKNQSSNNGIEINSVAKVDVQHITTVDGFDALREDWLRLHKDCETASLFNSWYWSRLWWQYYGDMGELFIIVIRVSDVVQCIAPFYRCQTRALKLRYVSTLRFIGNGGDTSPDDLGLLHNKEFEKVVSRHVCESVFHESGCVRLQLSDMARSSELVNTLLSKNSEENWGRPMERHQHRRISTLPDTIEAFEQSLSKNARKQRKRRRQKLSNLEQNVQFIPCVTHADIDSAYADLLRLHNMRHAEKIGGSDSFRSDRYQRFHLAAMKKALDNNELRLIKLVIDDKTIGVEYAFLCKEILSFFQTGFDPDYKHLSPGHLLMMETIDRGIEDGARRIDLLKGDYEYKQTYAKQIATTIDLELWKNPAVALIASGIRWMSNFSLRE